MRKFLAVYGFYILIAVLVTWPLATSFNTTFIGHPFGDVYEYIHHSWWIKTALQSGQPLYFQPLLAYPDGLASLWLWAIPLQSYPAALFALVMPLPAAFNLTIWLRLALNGWAMHRLAFDLTDGKRGPSLLAGLIFMLFPTFQGHLAAGHSGLLALWPVPLYILALYRLQAVPVTHMRRWLIAGALLFVVSLWGSLLLLIYLVGPVTLVMMLLPLLKRNWPGLRRTLLAVIVGGLIALLFMLPALAEEAAKPARLAEGGDVQFSADLLSVVTPSFEHPLFTHLPYTHQVLGIDPFERMGYIGILAGLLAMVGIWQRRDTRLWLALGVSAWVLSLGPLLKVLDSVVSINLGEQVSYITLPGLLVQQIPLLNIARTPARFNFTVALVVAILAGYGAAWLWGRVRHGRWPLLVLLAAWVVFEYQAFWPFPTIPGTVPQPVQALAAHEDIRAVFNIPWQHLLAQKDGMYLQTAHQQPMIAGHIARRTPVDPAKLNLLESTLDPALLDAAGVDVVILHKEWAQDAAAMQDRIPGDLLYEDARIAVYEMPPAPEAPRFTALVPDDPAIETQVNTYLFAPEPGWTHISGGLQATERDVMLLLDDVPVQRWSGGDAISFDLPVPIMQPGYHTLTLTADPPCPQHFDATLRCDAVVLDDLASGEFEAQTLPDSVTFARGVHLTAYAVEPGRVRLAWQFDESLTENDIRFVQVIDANGELAAQSDQTLGEQPAGGGWLEEITFADLSAGTYDVYAGWYTYPDFTRFPVLTDVPGAPDGWVHLGQMEARE